MNIAKNKSLIAAVAVAILAAIAWLAFGFFGIQSAFIDNTVNEDGPVFSASVETQDEVPATNDVAEAAAEADETQTVADQESVPEEEPVPDEAPAPEEEAVTNEIVTLFDGDFEGTSRYDVSGRADVLNDGSEQRFLRFEDFESSNGPDLKVYLRAENGDFIDLGDLKGNIGSQNYEIPADVDLSVFNSVEIWCERFSVGFGSATLSAV